jgi:hypothetical protein
MFRYTALLCLIIILLILVTVFNTVAEPVTVCSPDENLLLKTRSEESEPVEFFTEFVATKFERLSSTTQSGRQISVPKGESAFHPLNKLFITLHTIRR